MNRSITCLVSCLAVPALACGAAPDELADQRALWDAAGIEDYVYAYQKFCECHRDAPPETVVTVREGRITRVHHEHADSDRQVPARDGSFDLYWTIDELFALAAGAYDAGAEVRADYDAELGLPRRLYVDYDAALVGEELDIRITRFSAGAR